MPAESLVSNTQMRAMGATAEILPPEHFPYNESHLGKEAPDHFLQAAVHAAGRAGSLETFLAMADSGVLNLYGFLHSIPRPHSATVFSQTVKRTLDIMLSAVCLLLLSPVMLLTMVMIKLESRGPVLFKQKRSMSDHDQPFTFLKFRSMYDDADQLKESLLAMNDSGGVLFKLRVDPRVTRVGKFIRRYSLDELPQLFNVLRGEMSLVGPRPLPVGDFARARNQGHLGGIMRRRAHAKPGMTGLWQISGRSELGFHEMLLLDLYYMEHQSLMYDIEILFRTIPIVLFAKGAY